MANAIAGSLMILVLASAIGVPLGIGSGVFLAEYGRNRYGNVVRFLFPLTIEDSVLDEGIDILIAAMRG